MFVSLCLQEFLVIVSKLVMTAHAQSVWPCLFRSLAEPTHLHNLLFFLFLWPATLLFQLLFLETCCTCEAHQLSELLVPAESQH